jgi:hypothetical protein
LGKNTIERKWLSKPVHAVDENQYCIDLHHRLGLPTNGPHLQSLWPSSKKAQPPIGGDRTTGRLMRVRQDEGKDGTFGHRYNIFTARTLPFYTQQYISNQF